jgi:recombination protein U
MAQNVGKIFEFDFKTSCPKDMFIYRVPDIKYGVKSLCDFILYSYPRLFLLELKSTQEKTFPIKNIAEHQLENMSKYNKNYIVSGFIINFRHYEKTYFIKGDVLKSIIGEFGLKRLSVDTLDKYGKLIPQEKKRTRFRYNLDYFRGWE